MVSIAQKTLKKFKDYKETWPNRMNSGASSCLVGIVPSLEHHTYYLIPWYPWSEQGVFYHDCLPGTSFK